MSEELQLMVQIIELYGRGLGALGRAIRFSAKGAAKGVDVAKVKTMQSKMKLHCASTGNRKTMKLSDLEKLTGGQYNILNIPLENEKGLLGFYDRLKKMRVSFAELPDLQLGDGYTQIAYNPMDAENVKMVVQYYRKHLSEMPKDISIDQYMDMAGKDGKELLDELAEKGYTEGMHIEQLSEIQERIRDDNYIPISLNMESLLLQENESDSSAPDAVPEYGRAGDNRSERTEKQQNTPTLSAGQEKMAQILSAEQIKGYQSEGDYIPLSFDVETEILADSSNIYAVVLSGMPEDGEAHLRCAIINKADTRLSEAGKSITAYLKRDGESVVMVFNEKEEKIREYSQKNEEIATVCLKQQGERSGQGILPEPQKLQEISKSMPEKTVSGKRTAAKAVK